MRLSKARKQFRQLNQRYLKRGRQLAPETRAPLEETMEALDQALLRRDRREATRLVRMAREQTGHLLPRSPFERGFSMVVAIGVAIVVAVVIRQMWFEPMEIPSGSMRPTYLESDRLLVSKLPFGLNVPMRPLHLLFNRDRVQRTTPFIFTSQDMPVPNQDTTFLLFPSKLRLIKRCMAKPGDTVYFYGGQVYGIDREGRDLPELRNALTYVPFMQFDGKVTVSGNETLYNYFNEPLARLTTLPTGEVRTELLRSSASTLGDFYGMKNYAMARLLTRRQLQRFGLPIPDEAPLYLELRHNASLEKTELVRDEHGRTRPTLIPETSILPLTEEHLDRLWEGLYTSRFVVRDGRAVSESSAKRSDLSPFWVDLPGVPNGRYEFEGGIAYQIYPTGVRTRLSSDHPLLARTPQNLQRLFNLGIEMLTPFMPRAKDQPFNPARFAFWRDGELYVMNRPLLLRGEPELARFQSSEKRFIDPGPPSREMILERGFRLPDDGYLGLGDNYAGSGDSRLFGPVPEENIRGAPSFLIWPPHPHWGIQNSPPRPLFTTPRVIVWSIALITWLIVTLIRRRQANRLNFKRLS